MVGPAALPSKAQKRTRTLLLLVVAVATIFMTSAVYLGATGSSISILAVCGQALPGGVAARVLVEDNEWGRAAEAALRTWRASLFGRMAAQYKELERTASNNGTTQMGRVEPLQLSRYDLFNPFINCSSGNLTQLGSGEDGSKFICADRYLFEPGCVVYSLGSNGQYQFEEAVLAATSCEVHTFDCTYDGKALTAFKGRHHYHKTCVGQPSGTGGSAKANASQFVTYPAILARLGHNRVDLLKIDIEGFEFDVFSGFQPSCELPMQIAMEVHYSKLYGSDGNPMNFDNLFWSLHELSSAELAVFFAHFADLGYGVVNRDDNVRYGLHCCAEFTLIKVEEPAGCQRPA